MSKKSAAQVRRMIQRAERNGRHYEPPSSHVAVVEPTMNKEEKLQHESSSSHVEKREESKALVDEDADTKRFETAKKLFDKIQTMEQKGNEMNAKERRSAKRKAEAIAVEECGMSASDLLQWYQERQQQQQQQDEIHPSKSSHSHDSISKSNPTKDRKKINACLKFMKSMEKISTDQSLDAKSRRSAKRKAETIAVEESGCPSVKALVEWYNTNSSQYSQDTTSQNTSKKNPAPTRKVKTNPYILFIGQLSYQTTPEAIVTHFQTEIGEKKITPSTFKVRLLTDEKKTSKGMAFVEFTDPELMYECLKLHHSQLDGRRINVERSAGGKKNSESRKEKIKERRKEQEEYISETVNKILNEYREKGELKENELDEGVVALCCRRSPAIVEAALKEYVSARGSNLENPSAYLSRIICRITDEGIHDDKAETSKAYHRETTPVSKKSSKEVENTKKQKIHHELESSEFVKAGIDMSSSCTSVIDFSKIFPSMSRGRGRGHATLAS